MERGGVRGSLHRLRLAETPPHRPLPARGERRRLRHLRRHRNDSSDWFSMTNSNPSNATARAEGPLSRLLVLDFTQFLAGPYAGQIFGDLGARVIKIEPVGGEMARTIAPHFVKGDSAYFLAVNRNKESIAVDLKHARGRAIVLDLAKG